MNEIIERGHWRKFAIAAIVGALIMLFMEVLPLINAVNKHEYKGKVIDKSDAIEQAAAFVNGLAGYGIRSPQVMHHADKGFTGYLNKEKLESDYEKRYASRYPTDMFRVSFLLSDRGGTGFVDVNLYNGDIIGWKLSFVNGEEAAEPEQREALTRFMTSNQFAGNELDSLAQSSDAEWSVQPSGYTIGNAQLNVKAQATYVDGQTVVSTYLPSFAPPDDYKDYVKKQDIQAAWLTGVGHILMTIVFGILAIIYAILYRKHTSFKFGILLTIIMFVTFVIVNLNMLDVAMSSADATLSPQGMGLIVGIITVFVAIAIAGGVYLSIIAGDGLWKAQGRRVWPRIGEAGYGDYIWRSVGLSYLFALIMLGLQPLIFAGLGLVIGTWQAIDVSTSPYNMKIMWLMPALAWTAAIMEEAIYRLFGIGLFRRWFRNTFAAAIIPTVVWALGHVTYPFYPSTTRLFELIIIGLLFSYIFVRYGFATAVFTHAIFNTIAVGSALVMEGSPENIVSSVLFLVLPVLAAFALRQWDRRQQKKGPPPAPLTPIMEP